MPTFLGHAVSGLAVNALTQQKSYSARNAVMCAVCAVAPDLDGIGFRLGIPYGHWLGHRGFTHSVLFAVLLALLFSLFTKKEPSTKIRLLLAASFFLTALLHDVLDAMTNGGLGVAFFSPFSNTRYFLPWHAIEVSPISPARFFSLRGLTVLKSEFFWVMAPSFVVMILSWFIQHNRKKNTS